MRDNILIAEFMGFEKVTPSDQTSRPYWVGSFDEPLYDEEFQYHKSWDWLMPVVEEIENLGATTSFKTHYVRINPKGGHYDEYVVRVSFRYGLSVTCYLDDNEEYASRELRDFAGDTRVTKLEAIYIAVVEFIKWYNQNPDHEI